MSFANQSHQSSQPNNSSTLNVSNPLNPAASSPGTEIAAPGSQPSQSSPISFVQTPASDPFGAAIPKPPSLTLPKGGGAIHGIGEKFDVDQVNGTATTSIPIRTSPSRGGLHPALSLSYSSGAGNGPFGLGWSLSDGQITRKTDKGLPRYRDHGDSSSDDVFLLAGAEDLVPRFKLDAQGSIVLDNTGSAVIDDEVRNGYLVRRYSPRIESSFLRIERWTNIKDLTDIHWRTTTAANVTSVYGKDTLSRIYDPNTTSGSPQPIFSWLVAEVYDSRGNAMVFNYKPEDSSNVPILQPNELNRTNTTRSANRYLKSIQYGNIAPNRDLGTWTATSASALPSGTWMFSVVFDYGEHDFTNPMPNDLGTWKCRLDPFSTFRPGFEIRTYRLCRRILMFHHFTELGSNGCLVSSTDFNYQENSTASYLNDATLVGYSRQSNGNTYFKKSLPPLQFEYASFPTDEELSTRLVQNFDLESLESLPCGLDGKSYQWVDLDGEGLSGIFTEQGQKWYYKRNSSANNIVPSDLNPDDIIAQPKLDPIEILLNNPSYTTRIGQTHFGDVSGSGTINLIHMDPSSWGFFGRSTEDGWVSFRDFQAFPNVDTTNSDVRFIDLTGDGLPDVLIFADQIFSWYPSLGEVGYGEGGMVTHSCSDAIGPQAVFSDTELTIYLADMTGDGLCDLLRIRNGDICYWPNTGYGRFGALIIMDNAPWFDRIGIFNPKRLRLTDIDGSGTTDLLYLGVDGVDIYLNQSGNGFSDRKRLGPFAPIDDLSVVNVLDLLGNGTACIVWSSTLPGDSLASMKYIDIMKGKKPHLLRRMVNNLGAETTINYAPSTKFYLQDKENGNPWVTRLPFPVQCVEKVEVADRLSGNRYINSYNYHHGFFDGLEREFRGFAMVEHWDSEIFAIMNQTNASNVDASWHVPPTRTKTWFHTGTFIDRQQISRHLASEYFGAPSITDKPAMTNFLSTILGDSVLPSLTLGGNEFREACRALKGRILRTEVYADDGGPKSRLPYAINESNYTIVGLQPLQDANLHSVYTVHPRESISYHMDRNIDDPRIQHNIDLEIDQYGNVLKNIQIAYGRRPGMSALAEVDRKKQETALYVYTEMDFTNDIDTADDYRLRVSSECRQYELTGLRLSSTVSRFGVADFMDPGPNQISVITEIPYEQEQDNSSTQKRLLRRTRLFYRKDDFSSFLSLGRMESMAIPGETYEMAFTPGLLSSVFKRQTAVGPPENLIPDPSYLLGGTNEQQAGYIDLDGNGQWWKPSGHILFNPSPSATPAQELQEARAHFFQPRCFVNPFNNSTIVYYDAYSMFATSTTDAVGNTVTSIMDYRVLQVQMVIDTNGNRSAAAFDAMGLLAGTAVMGKSTEQVGDNLDHFNADPTQEEIDQFFDDPRGAFTTALLRGASSRNIYDVGRYWRDASRKQPAYSATIARETHFSEPVPADGLKIQIGFNYSDGFGQTIQLKGPTTPGPLLDAEAVVNNRWVGSGWTVYNNKGKPVKQYESFFDDTHDYKQDMKIGVTPILMYDPLLRVVARLRQDHALEKYLFDPWSQTSYDVNDNVLLSNPKTDPDIGDYFTFLPEEDYLPSWYDARKNGQLGTSEQAAAAKTIAHSNTPSINHFDVLGRTILAITDNGGGETVQTRSNLDIQSQQRSIVDGKGRTVATYDFDMCGTHIHQSNMEAGERWGLDDVLGASLLTWNSRGFRYRTVYDVIRRPIETWLRDGSDDELLIGRSIYGESLMDAAAHNLKGSLVQLMDQAGISATTEYDFKGNLLSAGRQFAENYKDILDWNNQVGLEETTYMSTTTYDALNRPIQTSATDQSITLRTYNQSGSLGSVVVNLRGEQGTDISKWTPLITNIDYNAKGQTTKIDYGNGTVVSRTYDRYLYRLQNLQTTRAPGNGQGLLQNLTYTYDPMGNISRIQDDAQQTLYFRNRRVEPSSDYTYDPTYRLIQATGREHLGQTNGRPSSPTAPTAIDLFHTRLNHPGDGNAVGRYVESYTYDVTGNITSMVHQGSDPSAPGWTKRYNYNEASQIEPQNQNNRLSSTSVGSAVEAYSYDGSEGLHGNITAMPQLPLMLWDFKDQLRATSKQTVSNGGTPEITYYVYDAAGKRVRKITEAQASSGDTPNRLKERLYLSSFEIYHEFEPGGRDVSLERGTLHVTDASKRFAIIETRTKGTDSAPQQMIRYQFDNQIGSSYVELDDQARIISYEEYFPYGSTSYQAVASQTDTPKRYRYTGKERDEESGLDYYGARYYASWLGRWTSSDPSGLEDGVNTFIYVGDNPVNKIDPTGNWKMDWKVFAISAISGACVVGIVIATGGVAAIAIPEGLALVGASAETIFAAEATTSLVTSAAGAVGLVQSAHDVAKTGRELVTGINADTGEVIGDKEGSEKAAQLFVAVGTTVLGAALAGKGGGLTPKGGGPSLRGGGGSAAMALSPSLAVPAVVGPGIYGVAGAAPLLMSNNSKDRGGGGDRGGRNKRNQGSDEDFDDEDRGNKRNKPSRGERKVIPEKQEVTKTPAEIEAGIIKSQESWNRRVESRKVVDVNDAASEVFGKQKITWIDEGQRMINENTGQPKLVENAELLKELKAAYPNSNPKDFAPYEYKVTVEVDIGGGQTRQEVRKLDVFKDSKGQLYYPHESGSTDVARK